MLKKKSELLQKENNYLFGKEFHEQISKTVNAYKQSQKLMASLVFKDAASRKEPFWIIPHQTNNIVRDKVLARTTTSKSTGTRIASATVHMQMKTTFFKEILILIPQEK